MVMGNPYQQNFQGQPALQPGFNPYRPSAPAPMPGPTPPGGKGNIPMSNAGQPGQPSTNSLDDYWKSILAGGL